MLKIDLDQLTTYLGHTSTCAKNECTCGFFKFFTDNFSADGIFNCDKRLVMVSNQNEEKDAPIGDDAAAALEARFGSRAFVVVGQGADLSVGVFLGQENHALSLGLLHVVLKLLEESARAS